jgi:hypothetical protein
MTNQPIQPDLPAPIPPDVPADDMPEEDSPTPNEPGRDHHIRHAPPPV